MTEITQTQASLNGVAKLTHLGVIRVQGEDAAKFLHGQLTQDFALLGQQEARLAAFCTAKGRMQASFIAFKTSDTEILLVCSRDILAATLKRLTMFVMRAKAKLTDATDELLLCGLAGSATQTIADSAHPAWAKGLFSSGSLVQLYPADGTPRQLWVAPIGSELPPGPELSLPLWLWSEVRSGIATLSQPTVEAFVPQMLNYESVGGVNFKKGCYPGQEVVARSQFRGTLKRRAFIAHADGPLQAGDEVFAPDDEEQPVATVVQAAASPLGGYDAIVSGQIAAILQGTLQLGAPGKLPMTVLPLPYSLLEDI
ncbi:MAG: folate-binding protein YgfZ [Rhodoferax sp.]|nr:folate-binding protein YgfZ [Rhodoferax sp.]